MRKFLALGGLLLLGACLTADLALANRVAPYWRSKDVPIRTSTITGDPNDQGYIDSSSVSLGAAATADTSAAILLDGLAHFAGDSNMVIRVEVIGASNFTSGDSIYVAVDCGTQFGGVWTNSASSASTCRSGGYCAATAFVPGTANSESKLLNGKGSATGTGALSASGTLGVLNYYGGFYGCPVIRLRFLQTIALATVTQKVHYRIWYLSTEESP